VGDDDFRGPLGPPWQWNHNPDPRFWSLSPETGQLKIRTDRVVPNLVAARHTLTQRMPFPRCAAEVTVDGQNLRVGDRAGLAVLQSAYGSVALTRTESGWSVVMVHRPLADGAEADIEEARVPVEGPVVRLRVEASFSAEGDLATFWLAEGNRRVPLGPSHALAFRLDHFVGCRFGLFVLATVSAGGEAAFSDFRSWGPEEGA